MRGNWPAWKCGPLCDPHRPSCDDRCHLTVPCLSRETQTELQLRGLDVGGLGTCAAEDLCVGLLPEQWTTRVWEPVRPCYVSEGGAGSLNPLPFEIN